MPDTYPLIKDLGLTAKLITFGPEFSDTANRAALAFRQAVIEAKSEGVEETATSLVSTFVRFDPLALSHDDLETLLLDLIQSRDWFEAELPNGRRLWTIPVVLGGESGPQFEEAATATGQSLDAARKDILASRTRVLTLGFAPGQPYMGELPDRWNIPRMSKLNPKVPGGALVTAIRQLIIFAGPAPTGWRHIGQTAFECFRPNAETPIALTAGDEVTFSEISTYALNEILQTDKSGNGGATWEWLL